MNRVLKTFLLWLLIAALPIQGMAAVVKASCGPQHHDMSSSMSTNGIAHLHDDGVLAHHESHDANAAIPDPHPDLEVHVAETSSDTGHTYKTSYCSACAACCVGAAAPPTRVSLAPVLSTVEVAVNPPVLSYTGFIPAGLERPPRLLSV